MLFPDWVRRWRPAEGCLAVHADTTSVAGLAHISELHPHSMPSPSLPSPFLKPISLCFVMRQPCSTEGPRPARPLGLQLLRSRFNNACMYAHIRSNAPRHCGRMESSKCPGFRPWRSCHGFAFNFQPLCTQSSTDGSGLQQQIVPRSSMSNGSIARPTPILGGRGHHPRSTVMFTGMMHSARDQTWPGMEMLDTTQGCPSSKHAFFLP